MSSCDPGGPQVWPPRTLPLGVHDETGRVGAPREKPRPWFRERPEARVPVCSAPGLGSSRPGLREARPPFLREGRGRRRLAQRREGSECCHAAGTDLRGTLSEGSGDAGVHSARRRRRLAGSDGRPAMLPRAASARGAGRGRKRALGCSAVPWAWALVSMHGLCGVGHCVWSLLQ